MSALEAIHARDAFARLLAHDLRSPMGPLVLAVSTLAEDPGLDAGAREIAHLALAQADRMMRLLQATLWTLRAPQVAPAVFDLGRAIGGAVACVDVLGVACSVRPNIDMRAHGDAARVSDALAGVLEVAAGAVARVDIDGRVDGARAIISIHGEEPLDEPPAGAPSDARAALLHGARALFVASGGGMTVEGTEVRAWLRVA